MKNEAHIVLYLQGKPITQTSASGTSLFFFNGSFIKENILVLLSLYISGSKKYVAWKHKSFLKNYIEHYHKTKGKFLNK